VNDKTHFGFESIDEDLKTKKVKNVFESVATRYDLMNTLMSGGLHKIWKKYFTQILTIKNNSKILDLASGTGDICIELAKQNKNFKIFHTDINIKMLEQGQIKLVDHGKIIPSLVCDAEKIPFQTNYFDCVTIAFGLRNVTNKRKALAEIFRVLSPGGKLVILEFSKVWSPLTKIYDSFSFNILPKLGKIFAKDQKSYQYLVESIRMHPDQKTLKTMMENEGFEKTSFLNLSGGIVAIHQGYKF
jgi:demethylmenaquinone methyltransferase/2-methoxy-6-polyprenyl-1,4-benzoquinol methylase